jgi:hypothetical protein
MLSFHATARSRAHSRPWDPRPKDKVTPSSPSVLENFKKAVQKVLFRKKLQPKDFLQNFASVFVKLFVFKKFFAKSFAKSFAFKIFREILIKIL